MNLHFPHLEGMRSLGLKIAGFNCVEQLCFGFLDNLREKELQKVVYLFKMLAWSSLFLVSNDNGKRWWYPLLQKPANAF